LVRTDDVEGLTGVGVEREEQLKMSPGREKESAEQGKIPEERTISYQQPEAKHPTRGTFLIVIISF